MRRTLLNTSLLPYSRKDLISVTYDDDGGDFLPGFSLNSNFFLEKPSLTFNSK